MSAAKVLLVLCSLGSLVPGQTSVQPTNTLTGQPLSMFFGPNTFDISGAPKRTDWVHFRKSGLGPASRPWSNRAGVPDMRFRSMFGSASVRVNAFSLGFDYLPMKEPGVLEVPPNEWGILLFSVRRGVDSTEGGVVEAQTRGNGAGADVFEYVYEGSSGQVPRRFTSPERVHLVTDNSTLGIRDQDRGRRDFGGQITALDGHLASFQLDSTLIDALPSKARPRIFFSVDRGTVVPPSWGLPPISTPAGFVFTRRWTGTAWGPVEVLLFPGQLGIASRVGNVDSLAIAWDYDKDDGRSVRLIPFRMVYSTVRGTDSLPSQLMYVGRSASGFVADPPVALQQKAGGTKKKAVAPSAKVQLLDITGTCSQDPSLPVQVCDRAKVWDFVFGPPTNQVVAPMFPVSPYCAVFRDCDSMGRVVMKSQLAGWRGSSSATAFHVWFFGDAVGGLPGTVLAVTAVPRGSGAGATGSATAELTLPASISGTLERSACRSLSSWWLTVDGAVFRQSLVARIRL